MVGSPSASLTPTSGMARRSAVLTTIRLSAVAVSHMMVTKVDVPGVIEMSTLMEWLAAKVYGLKSRGKVMKWGVAKRGVLP